MINISSAINVDKLRAQGPGRPELDWSVLTDDEIYPFLVQHEIGHRQDNFDGWDIMLIKDLTIRDECHRRVRFVNEMLADRYAWGQIRPGEPIPLSEHGKKMQEKAAYSLAFLEQHARKTKPCKPEWRLTPGPYRDVPAYMLASLGRAAYLGPNVSKKLVAERATYYQQYNQENRRPLF